MIKSENVIAGIGLLIGTVLGAGMFALPYLFQKVGIVNSTIIFFVTLLLALAMHFMLVEIILNTSGRHRIPGYIRKKLGKEIGNFSVVSSTISAIGALLAYMALGGIFLKQITFDFLGASLIPYSFLFFLIGSILILFGNKTVKKSEIYLTALLIITIGLVSYFSLNHFVPENIVASGNGKIMFLLYGALLFSFWGTNIIPLFTESLNKDKKLIFATLFGAYGLIAFLYFIFAFSVMGASGGATTGDAITGLSEVLGRGIVYLGSLMGFLAVITSYISVGITLEEIFKLDYKLINKKYAPLILVAPLIVFLLGFQDFVKIISILGALFIGIEGILILIAHHKIKNELKQRILPILSTPVYLIIFALLAAGIVSSFFSS